MRALLLLLLAGCPSADEPPIGAPPLGELVADAGEDGAVLVGEAIGFDGGGSVGAASYAWDFGDGDASAPSGSAETEHVYGEPGHYVAVLSVQDADGRARTDARVITAHLPAAEETIINPSALAEHDGRFFVPMPDFDQVAVVQDGEVTHLDTCGEPRSVAIYGERLAVACTRDAVDVFDLSTAPPTRQRILAPHGSAPFAAIPAPDGYVYASLQGRGALGAAFTADEFSTFDDRYPDIRALAVGPGGFFATRHRSPDEHGVFYTGNNNTLEHPLARDPGPDSDTGARGVPTYLERLAVSPDGTRIAIGGLQANVERGLFLDGQRRTHETAARAMVRLVDPEGNELDSRHFDDRDRVSALAWSPLGDWLFAATHGMETVEVLDSWSLELTGAFLDVCRGPDGLWTDGDVLWVACGLSRELVAYSLAELGAPPEELARISLLPPTGEVLDAEVLLGKQIFHRSADPRMTKDGYLSCATCHLDGDQDGRVWDFTDRGEGLRNTISLLGRGGAAPIHWSANFDEVQDFEHDIRGPMQGAGFLSDEDWKATNTTLGAPKAGLSAELDALAAYVMSLTDFPRSPFRQPDGQMSEAALAGEVLFLDPTLGCIDCHPAPDYTDSQFLAPGEPLLHDVGTLGDGSGQRMGAELLGIDTPTLRGLATGAPYLHDGSAATLREVLVERNPDDLHGVTSHLDEAAIDNLEAFLLELE